MPIRVVCDGCGKGIKAPDKYAGKTAKCPGCGQQLAIPAPDIDLDEFVSDRNVDDVLKPISAPPALPVPNDGVAQSTKVAKSNAFPPTDDQVACPFCAEMIKAEANKCRYCGEFLHEKQTAQPTVTEATGKRWKIIQIVSVISLLVGFSFVFLGISLGDDTGSGSGPIATVIVGIFFLLSGIGMYIVARFGAWWYHG